MVHRRSIDGTPIVLGNQGALWGNAMTWWDHETGSVWSQPLGEAILGPLTGTRLELLSSTLTTWDDWRAQHPSTLALDAPGGQSRFDAETLDTVAVVVELGPDSMAFPIADVRLAGVANAEVGGTPVAVVVDPVTGRWAVFSRWVDDQMVDLELVDGVLSELGGTRRFDPASGAGLEGDAALDRLPGFTSFPGDYATFWPDGVFWTIQGLVPATS